MKFISVIPARKGSKGNQQKYTQSYRRPLWSILLDRQRVLC